jgi:hypothetical protein
MGNLGLALKSQGRLAEAEPLYREVWPTRPARAGPEHPDTAFDMDRLANLLSQEGRLAEPKN